MEQQRTILIKLADTIISAETTPFTFDCEIKYKDTDGTERVTMCCCTEEERDKLSQYKAFDESVFYYMISTDTILRDTMNNKDWEIVDVYEDSVCGKSLLPLKIVCDDMPIWNKSQF